jgi:hypothetical protein
MDIILTLLLHVTKLIFYFSVPWVRGLSPERGVSLSP